MIISLCLFSAIWIVSICLIENDYKKHRTTTSDSKLLKPANHFNNSTILVVAILYVSYNIYVTFSSNGELGNDRLNYLAYFNEVRPFNNIGLELIMRIVRMLKGDIFAVFYLTTFLVVIITLFSFNIASKVNIYSISLLFFSQYFVFSFTALKQTYANALACLFFSILLSESDNKYKDFWCVLIIVLALLFHPAGLILIPFYLLFKIKKKRSTILVFVSSLVLIVVFLDPLMNWVAGLIKPFLPALSNHIVSYFGESKIIIRETSAFAFIKGLPIFIICILGWINRDYYRSKINNYDYYLISSIVCSSFYIIGTYTAWFFRFSYLLFFPTFILFGILIHNSQYRSNKLMYLLTVTISMLVFTYREIALIYVNWKGVW